jgi:hypothetical protein
MPAQEPTQRQGGLRGLTIRSVRHGNVGAHARQVPALYGGGHVVEDALPGAAGEPAGGGRSSTCRPPRRRRAAVTGPIPGMP